MGVRWSANSSFSACNCLPAKDKGDHPNESTHEADAEQELVAPQQPIMTRVGSSGGFRQYSLEELSIATSGFSDEKKFGEGTYGTVYIASLDNNEEPMSPLFLGSQNGNMQGYRFWSGCPPFTLSSSDPQSSQIG
ncbi:hypothetical protein Drorol1_Dr00002119 [Drosera rotundifolia]